MVDGAAGDSSAPVENVAELKFGPEFEDIHILSNAQVAVILQVSARSAVNRDEELNEVYRKTQHYVNRFNTMTNPEKVRGWCWYMCLYLCINDDWWLQLHLTRLFLRPLCICDSALQDHQELVDDLDNLQSVCFSILLLSRLTRRESRSTPHTVHLTG